MRKEYNFSKTKKNLYAKEIKNTLQLDMPPIRLGTSRHLQKKLGLPIKTSLIFNYKVAYKAHKNLK